MIKDLFILMLSAAVIVGAVRYLLMFAAQIGTSYITLAGLLGFFVLYKVMDRRLNKTGQPALIPVCFELFLPLNVA